MIKAEPVDNHFLFSFNQTDHICLNYQTDLFKYLMAFSTSRSERNPLIISFYSLLIKPNQVGHKSKQCTLD